jgi:vitamin B12 transporter
VFLLFSRPRARLLPLSCFALFITTLTSSPTVAQTKVEPVVVTASRTAEAVAQTLRDVTVLSGEALEQAGVSDLVTALQSVAGVEVVAPGPGATPSIFLRGGNSNQVLILLDGQRIGSTFSGLSALQHIAVSQIDRIEIVRGPAASLYGADAVSGVIQIFTKREGGLSANAMFGEARSSDVSARAGFANAGNSLSISANHRETRGYKAIVNPADFSFNPDRDGYRFTSAKVNGSLAVSPTLTLEGNLFAAHGKVQYDGGADFDDRIESDVHNASVKARYAPSKRWTSSLVIGQSVDKSEFISSFDANYKTTQSQAGWQNNFNVHRDLALWNALEWRRERVSSSDDFATTSRRTTSLAVGANANLNTLKVASSLRLDDSSQYAKRTTGNLALGYTLSTEWRVLVNAGTSFKAPTFNDLYYPGFANPNLGPEKAKNVDVALAWSREATNAKLVVYENRVRDLIQFICDANFNCAAQNVAKAKLRGATLSAGTRIASWSIEGSLDVADPIDAGSGKQLPRRAKLHGAFKASGEIFGVKSGVEWIASGDRFDNASNTRRLAGYGVVNLFARRDIMRGVSLGVRIDNALDRDYQQAFGYASGGRRAWLTMSINQL